MATKRRKVWVNFYGDDRMDEVYRSRSSALDYRVVGEDAEDAVVPFIERLPGDVVLSREESARIDGILKALEGAPVERSSTVSVLIKNGSSEIRDLLRGRR